MWSRRELCTIVLQTRSVRAEDTQYLCTNALSHALTEQLKRDLHEAMYTFDIEFTATLAELKTKRFNNIRRQEQMSEKIWHLERRVMEQRVEEMEVAEALTKTRSELKGLKDRWRTLSPLLDSEEYWIKTVGGVSVCVCVAIGDSLSHCCRSSIMCSHSSIQRRAHT